MSQITVVEALMAGTSVTVWGEFIIPRLLEICGVQRHTAQSKIVRVSGILLSSALVYYTWRDKSGILI